MNSTFLRAAGLLIVSNTFMTFAWYAHLNNLGANHQLSFVS